MFQPVFKYFKTLTNGSKIIAWKSARRNEVCQKKILNLLLQSDNRLVSWLTLISNAKVRLKFDGNCLR